jgi:hypothetical protein
VQLKIENREAKEIDWEVLPPEEKTKRSALQSLFRLVAFVMDGLLRLPGTKRRLGLNPIIDFIPVVGDVGAAFVSASVLVYAFARGLPKVLLSRMALNVAINELVGVIPVVGSVFAFWFRANKRNYDLLQRHIAEPHRSRKGDWAFVLGLIVLLTGVFVAGWLATLAIFYWIARLISGHP